jgi:hypothetical protein
MVIGNLPSLVWATTVLWIYDLPHQQCKFCCIGEKKSTTTVCINMKPEAHKSLSRSPYDNFLYTGKLMAK